MAEEREIKEGRYKSSHSIQTLYPYTINFAPQKGDEIDDILVERLENLGEAIEELDNALVVRKALSKKFIHQINKEIEEIDFQLDHLSPPWKMGFYPQFEFFRLSLHKSMTSRKKDIRSEELSHWQDVISLRKEKRKFLDEYKSLWSAKKRLIDSSAEADAEAE